MTALTPRGRFGLLTPYSQLPRLPQGLTRSPRVSVQPLSAPKHLYLLPRCHRDLSTAWTQSCRASTARKFGTLVPQARHLGL